MLVPIRYYHHSVLASVFSALGTILAVVGLTLLSEESIAAGIVLIFLAVLFFAVFAPLAARSAQKKAAQQAGMPLQVYLQQQSLQPGRPKKSAAVWFVFAGVFAVLAVCAFFGTQEESGYADQVRTGVKIETLDFSDTNAETYINDDVGSFLDIFAYKGDTESEASEYYCVLVAYTQQDTRLLPVVFPRSEYDEVTGVMDDYVEYLLDDDAQTYTGRTYHLTGTLKSMYSMEDDAYQMYQEYLTENDFTDMQTYSFLEIRPADGFTPLLYICIGLLVLGVVFLAVGIASDRKIKAARQDGYSPAVPANAPVQTSLYQDPNVTEQADASCCGSEEVHMPTETGEGDFLASERAKEAKQDDFM